MTLKDKVILVTGGSTGIGRASCLLFAEQGAQVIFVGRRQVEGEKAEEALVSQGLSAAFYQCDISDPQQLDELFSHISHIYGRLDGAFNCGGVDGPKASILDCSLDDWDQILGINLRGTFLLVKHELAIMVPQGSGTIINMSSVCATIARPGRVAYNTSRHGVDAITKTAALEYASKGIRINAIAPGSIRTDIFHRSTQGDPTREKQYNQAHPIGRIGEPEEVAQAALWLLSDAPDFMQGHTLMLDGGFTIQ